MTNAGTHRRSPSKEESPESREDERGDREMTNRVTLENANVEEQEDLVEPREESVHSTKRETYRIEPDESTAEPPLPDEAPPLPQETPLEQVEDDGWAPVWDDTHQAYYFYNRLTGASQWTNPRVPEATDSGPPGVGNYDRMASSSLTAQAPGTEVPEPVLRRPHGGYDPAIHGDYDPTAPYAQEAQQEDSLQDPLQPVLAESAANPYAATGHFNRFTGKWQADSLTPENFNDENKSKRQMNAFFDVDAAANSHNGKSLKAERSGKKLTKQELKAFKEKRKEKKEERRRAWLRD